MSRWFCKELLPTNPRSPAADDCFRPFVHGLSRPRNTRNTLKSQGLQTVEHKLSEWPTCHKPLGKPCGKHGRVVEYIPPVRPIMAEHIICEYHCSPCGAKA